MSKFGTNDELKLNATRGLANYLSKDPVNNPSHYTSGNIECIDAITEAISTLHGSEAYHTGATMKYLWRWKRKNGLEDLKKAQWHLTRLINEIENPK